MSKKIYKELVLIKKELIRIRKSLEKRNSAGPFKPEIQIRSMPFKGRQDIQDGSAEYDATRMMEELGRMVRDHMAEERKRGAGNGNK